MSQAAAEREKRAEDGKTTWAGDGNTSPSVSSVFPCNASNGESP